MELYDLRMRMGVSKTPGAHFPLQINLSMRKEKSSFYREIYGLRMRMGLSKVPAAHFSTLDKPSVSKRNVWISLGSLCVEDAGVSKIPGARFSNFNGPSKRKAARTHFRKKPMPSECKWGWVKFRVRTFRSKWTLGMETKCEDFIRKSMVWGCDGGE